MLPTTDVGPIINETQLKRAHSHTRLGLRDGAKLLCGGEVVKEGECKRGFFYAPTVFGEATSKMRMVQEEVLGPTLALLSVAGLDETIEQVNVFRHDVTTTVYTRDIARAVRAIDSVRAGRVYVNPIPPNRGAPLPLTGFSPLSRIHRQAGSQNLVDFGAWKEVGIDSVGQRP
jgi:aldehyde dehydrogenase (NAD+)